MKKNIFFIKALYLITLSCINYSLFAQFKDTTTNVYQDKDLIIWTKNYIVKAGYINKNNKGYQIPLVNRYYKDLDNLYSLSIIEKQEYDTLSVILYWLHAGTDNDRPIIIKRVIMKDQKSKFEAIGKKCNLESLPQIYLLFELYKKFSESTQLFCYKMLLQNYEWRISKVEE